MILWQAQRKNFRIGTRIGYLAVGIAVFVIAYSVGAMAVTLTDDEASTIIKEFTESVQGIQGEGIFSNNAVIGLGMFIPAVGAGIGIYSAYSTGIIFNAFAHMNPDMASVSPISVFATPFGILELFAYGLGISRSGILVKDLIRRKPWKEYIIMTLIEIAIAVIALVIGAYVESSALGTQS